MWRNKIVLVGMIFCFVPSAYADGQHESTSPDQHPKVNFIAGFGLKSLAANRAYPAPRLPGVLESGSARADERNSGLDYAELGIKITFTDSLTAKIKGARHGGSSPLSEIEEAWLSAEHTLQSRPWHAQLGRQQVPLGLQNQQHFHSWAFGIAPLAMRAAINDSWRADGLRVESVEPSGLNFGAGLWNNSAFPGAPSSGINLAHLRLGWKNARTQIEAGYARADVNAGRPLVTLGSAGHTHTLPSCGAITATRVCFNGHADVVAVAGKLTLADTWWLGGEGWLKKESGKLDSIFGTPDYAGTLTGGWLDLGWTPHPQWSVIVRGERVVASHQIAGSNASLIANQAGIADSNRALKSYGIALNWKPAEAHHIALEHHRENVEVQSNSATLLRYQYSFEH
ncbi:MAG: hypothetical protein HOP01_01145 [Gallionella sp.]|nr:hypothetical protein [Gallionella sp.]